MKLNGKLIRKSMSIVLAVMMLASLCAVSFGSTASAAGTAFTKTYDFKNDTAVKDAYGTLGTSIDSHYLISFSGNQDGVAASSYNWDKTSGFTSYGVLVGAAAPCRNTNGWTKNNHRLVLRGAADDNTDANGSIILKEGWTYEVSVKYANVSSDGWSDYPTIAIGMANNSNQARTFADVTPSTELNMGGNGYYAAKNAYAPNIITAQDKSGLSSFETNHAAKFGTWVANNKWKTYTAKHTAVAGDVGNMLCVTFGTNKSGGSINDAKTWKLTQYMVESVTVKVTPPPTGVFFEEGGVKGPEQDIIVDGKVELYEFEDFDANIYWTTSKGGVYFPGETVPATAGDTFIAHAIPRVTDPAYSVADGAADYGNAALSGIRFKGSVPAATIDAATSVSFKVMPKVAITSAGAPADWYVDGKYTYTLDKDVENFKTDYYEKTDDAYTYQLCIRKLSAAQMAADFMVVIEVVGEGGTEYFYIGCQDYNSVLAGE